MGEDRIGFETSALLSGRALEVYSRLSEEAAQDYDRVKLALMKRYDLTEDGYRRKLEHQSRKLTRVLNSL